MACLLTKGFYMTQDYTLLNDLVRLVYRETSSLETRHIREEISFDYELAEEYNTMRKAVRELPKVTFAPSPRCIDSILEYSRKSALAV